MSNWDYVMSGMAYTIFRRDTFENQELIEQLRTMMTKMNAFLPGHNMCVLFNGYQEKLLGKMLHKIFDKTTEYYVDSGGLQMITLGINITQEQKRKIYHTQGEMGDFAMSFDEIPVKLLSDRSTFHDTSSRVFDVERFDECARLSGQNLKDQILYFKEMGSVTKPFLIVQGNDFDYYQRWTDLVLEEVGSDLWDSIGGLSVGAAALGQGEFQDYKRAFFASELQMPDNIKKHIHLLGVGSIKRLAPMVSLKHGGHFAGSKISYDSTTHTSGLSMMQYQMGNKLSTFKYGMLKEFPIVSDDVCNFAQNAFGITLDPEFLKSTYLDNRATYFEKYTEDREQDFQIAKFCTLFSSVKNFMISLDKMDNNIEELYDVVGHKNYGRALSFSKITDVKDFNEWCKYNENSLRSKGVVSSNDVSSMEDLFV
jgi:hypothetical protein